MPGSLSFTAGRSPMVGEGAGQAHLWVHPPPSPTSPGTSLEATEPGLLSCRSHASHFLAIGANFVARGDSGTLPALVLTDASRPRDRG